jgi:transposase
VKIYTVGVRYADGGGLNKRSRARREAVRMQAADLFEWQVPARQVAWQLRVSTKSAYQWQRIWRRDGREGLPSKGPSGAACRLDEARLDRLQAELDRVRPRMGGWRTNGGRCRGSRC